MYVNAHVLNRSRESLSLRMALEQADLVYCDGYGVRLAAKALEVETPHRMTGADWIWGLASLCESGGHSIYLLGCDPGIAAEAARRLRRQYPRLRGQRIAPRVLRDRLSRMTSGSSRTSTPGGRTSCWSAWALPSRRNGSSAMPTASTCRSAGRWALCSTTYRGAFRARPGWLADNGLEWIFRLMIEPQRMWRRYLLGNPVFVTRVLLQARAKRSTHA